MQKLLTIGQLQSSPNQPRAAYFLQMGIVTHFLEAGLWIHMECEGNKSEGKESTVTGLVAQDTSKLAFENHLPVFRGRLLIFDGVNI